jgi:hypothetical protein
MFSEELKVLTEAVNLLSQQVGQLHGIIKQFDSKLDTRNAEKLLKQFKKGKKRKKA